MGRPTTTGMMLGATYWWRTCCRWCPPKPDRSTRRKLKRSERQKVREEIRP